MNIHHFYSSREIKKSFSITFLILFTQNYIFTFLLLCEAKEIEIFIILSTLLREFAWAKSFINFVQKERDSPCNKQIQLWNCLGVTAIQLFFQTGIARSFCMHQRGGLLHSQVDIGSYFGKICLYVKKLKQQKLFFVGPTRVVIVIF